MIQTFTKQPTQFIKEGAYKTVICIGNKAGFFKSQLIDHQFVCIPFTDIEQASFSLRNALTENGFLPSAIIIDVETEGKELNKLLTLIKKSALLRNIPLFLFVDDLKKNEIEKYSKLPLVDDIYTTTSHVSEIIGRIAFLTQFKKQIKKNNTDKSVIEVDNKFSIDFNYFLKRTGDVVVSLILILLLSPLFLLIALAIAIESRGPIIYSSERAGRGFKIFKFYKFRSMYLNADSMIKKLSHLNQYQDGDEDSKAKFFKISNDPRITKVGKFLRNTSLDELPQLFNILKGDMSLVGNRPLPLYEANTITTDDYSKRFLAPAGLTGLWQVSKRGNKDMSTEERLNLDVEYSEQWSFMSDFNIIMKTPKALIQKDNV